MSVKELYLSIHSKYIRLFLFQTAFPSGAAFPPFAEVELLMLDWPKPLPDFATRRGFETFDVEGARGVIVDPAAPLSPTFIGVAPAAPLAAKNVLLTETALKDFLTVEELRVWPSPCVFDFMASVSEPPFTLTSADVAATSIWSVSFDGVSTLACSATGGWSLETS
jgi:hypothetical protein